MKGKINVKKEIISTVENAVFGILAEHLGRVIYNGIYEPTHKTADEHGFRGDVIELAKELGISAIRYPGGNFVSGYHWKDGIGPKENRPKRLNLAWGEIEPNEVGIDEFLAWAKKVGCEVIMAVNMGNGSPQEAAEEIEYCNIPGGTQYSDMRVQNGAEEPYKIRYWCIGNEMDGDYQIGALPAAEYGRKAYETIKQMKLVDPSCKCIVCGNSSPLASVLFSEWNRTVLKNTYKNADFLSIHAYYDYGECESVEDFLASPVGFDQYIQSAKEICDEVKAELNSEKTLYLSIDEWNVWHRYPNDESHAVRFKTGEPLLENIYDMADALVVGSLITVLINNCDRVKLACLAQLVNTIAPILTKVGGEAIRQTTFYPFSMFSACRGLSCLKQEKQTDTYISEQYGEAPYLYSAICFDESNREYVCCLVNVAKGEYQLELNFPEEVQMTEWQVLTGDLHVSNTFDNPYAIAPCRNTINRKKQTKHTVTLAQNSVNMIKFRI